MKTHLFSGLRASIVSAFNALVQDFSTSRDFISPDDMRNLYNMKRILPLILSFAFVGCSQDRLPENPLEHFNVVKEVAVSKTIELGDFDILKPLQVCACKDWYVFDDMGDQDSFVKFLSFDCQRSHGVLRLGNGPFELTKAHSIFTIDDSLYVLDPNLKRIVNIDYDDSFKLSYLNENCRLSMLAQPVDRDRFINITPFKSDYFMTLIDAQGNIYSTMDYPYDSNLSGQPVSVKSQMFMGTKVLISPSRDKFAWGVNYFPSFGFGRIDNDSLILDKEFEYRACEFEPVDSRQVITKNSSITNVASCFALDEYAVFLYRGTKYGDHDPLAHTLLFYTWQGEPYMKVTLEKGIIDVKYDKKRNVVYGISNDPEPVLIEYDMTGIID